MTCGFVYQHDIVTIHFAMSLNLFYGIRTSLHHKFIIRAGKNGMVDAQKYFKPGGFYQNKPVNMSGRGRGNKNRKRDLIDAPRITPATTSSKGNLQSNKPKKF